MDHEWLIGLGVQTVLFLAGGYAMVLKNDWSNKVLEDRMDAMGGEMQKLAQVITQLAVQDVRINNLTSQLISVDKRVEDLRRGNGYVKGVAHP